jgi:hypothetical protein
MDELTDLWDRLSLKTKEECHVDLSGDARISCGILAVKFLTKRVLNIKAVLRTLRPLWRANSGFKGHDTGNNKVLFIFNDTMDMERVIANGPLSFDKFLILLKRIDDDESLSKVVFDTCSFWVQIHER